MTQQKLATELDFETLRRAAERGDAAFDQTIYSESRPLPYCAYPKAREVAQYGIQLLPASLPLVDFAQAQPHRSNRYTTVSADRLTPGQVLQMARVVAASFARREPQSRHLRSPRHPPVGLMEERHTDPFGSDPFGPWRTKHSCIGSSASSC